MKSSMTIEEDFVTLCAVSRADEQRREFIRKAVTVPMDWGKIFDTAVKSRTLPLLFKSIRTKPFCDSVPPELMDKMSRICAENLKRNFFLLSYLFKLLKILKADGILAVPFKGPVFAEDVYGDLGLRFTNDLDLLVQKKDAQKAYDVLIKNSLVPEITLEDGRLKKYIDTEDNLSFMRHDPKIIVELHWELTGNYLSKSFALEDMLETLVTVSIHNHNIPVFPPETLLLYLCIHGAKHEWDCLDWVCCVAELIRKEEEIDWELVEAAATSRKAKKMLFLGLQLSWILFKAPIPAQVLDKIKDNMAIGKLSWNLIPGMFHQSSDDETSRQKTRFSSFHFRVRDSLSDSIRYLSRLVFSPSKKDWASFRLPASFSTLYYVLRPCRLIASILRP